MTVAVTGGSGRLGRSVLVRWLAGGERVVNLDREPSGIPGVVDRLLDLTDADATASVLRSERPHSVVHLAAIAVPFSAPEERIRAVNPALARHVLAASAEIGVERVLVASSPTVIGYGAPTGWHPEYLPLDERHPLAPWNAYSESKRNVEQLVREHGSGMRVGAFRPCYVITPEEWSGAPTQQGHTVAERLDDPGLAAVSLFNYVDARDAADFTIAWAAASARVENGSVYFVGAADALAREPLASLLPRFFPELSDDAAALTGTRPAFDCSAAERDLGWTPTRSWRSELSDVSA